MLLILCSLSLHGDERTPSHCTKAWHPGVSMETPQARAALAAAGLVLDSTAISAIASAAAWPGASRPWVAVILHPVRRPCLDWNLWNL